MGTVGKSSVGKRFLEVLQDQHCDETRTTEKRFRVLRNVGEAAEYFPINEPVLCFGSGDGFEVEVWNLLGFKATGYDISQRKNKLAKKHGVDVGKKYPSNIYCAHTLEHLENRNLVLDEMRENCISTICLIFPIEPIGSNNPSHLSPIKSLNDINLDMMVVLKYERLNNEREGVIIFKK